MGQSLCFQRLWESQSPSGWGRLARAAAPLAAQQRRCRRTSPSAWLQKHIILSADAALMHTVNAQAVTSLEMDWD